MKKKNDFRID